MPSTKTFVNRPASDGSMNSYLPPHNIPEADFVEEVGFVTRQMLVEQVPAKIMFMLLGADNTAPTETIIPPPSAPTYLPWQTYTNTANAAT